MNIGSAVRSHELDAVHIDVANTWPAGVAAFVSTAANPHTANARAIHTPEPRIANNSSIKASESCSSFIRATFAPRHGRACHRKSGLPGLQHYILRKSGRPD